jgi:hypothetical protein
LVVGQDCPSSKINLDEDSIFANRLLNRGENLSGFSLRWFSAHFYVAPVATERRAVISEVVRETAVAADFGHFAPQPCLNNGSRDLRLRTQLFELKTYPALKVMRVLIRR